GDVRLAPGDVAYVLGRPDALRRVTDRALAETRDGGGAPDPGENSDTSGESDADHELERPRDREQPQER
ncbi:hypothetical protein ACFQE6_03110, partial [Natrinema soli]